MTLSRVLATGAAIALIGASAFALAGSATAADAPANPPFATNYVTAGQFGSEAAQPNYPQGWFTGTIANQGTITSGVSGLAITANEQLLNGTTPLAGLSDLVNGNDANRIQPLEVNATGPVAFQIPIFANVNGTANTGFTTLVPNGIGQTGIDADAWHVTQNVSVGSVPVLLTGQTYTIEQIEGIIEEVGSPVPYKILAYGIIVADGFTATLQSVTWNNVTSQFTPQSTAVITPATLTPAETADATKGVTATFTGFLPGETVTFGIGTGNSGDSLPDTAVADETGSVTLRFISATPLDPGTQFLSAFGTDSGATASGSFVVAVAAVTAVVADPALAATGIDSTPYLISGGILVLLGLGFGFIALRRRSHHA